MSTYIKINVASTVVQSLKIIIHRNEDCGENEITKKLQNNHTNIKLEKIIIIIINQIFK